MYTLTIVQIGLWIWFSLLHVHNIIVDISVLVFSVGNIEIRSQIVSIILAHRDIPKTYTLGHYKKIFSDNSAWSLVFPSFSKGIFVKLSSEGRACRRHPLELSVYIYFNFELGKIRSFSKNLFYYGEQ